MQVLGELGDEMTVSVKIEGMEPLTRKLHRLHSMEPVRAGLGEAGEHVKSRLAKYPPRRRGPLPGGFKSDKQRRKVFALIREGEIPYRRGQSSASEDLGQRWNVRVSGLTATVGNNASYGPLVQDRKQQAMYHRITGWTTIQDVAEQEGPEVVRIISKHIDKALGE